MATQSTIEGYVIKELIHEGMNTFIYRAQSKKDNTPVVMKMLKSDYPTTEEIAKLQNEYAILMELSMDSVTKVIDFIREKNKVAIVLEDFNAISVKQRIFTENLDLTVFLRRAIRITEILSQIHAKNIIHKDVKPANILIGVDNEEIKFSDFGISKIYNPEIIANQESGLEGTLAYISPEQTGRINRTVDFRSDFYSLGITFYELLTHRLPFDSADIMALIHSHIALFPPSITEVKPEVPEIINKLVMKLMAKNPEDRYQSANGIINDLEKILEQIETKGTADEFPLGEGDKLSTFHLSEKLYGREEDIKKLTTLWEEASESQKIMCLIHGNEGTGKSRLPTELQSQVLSDDGFFARAELDINTQQTPFQALILAFRPIINQMIADSSENIRQWKLKFQSAVSSNGQLIIDIIPEIEHLIGEQPPVEKLEGIEAVNRLNRVFYNVISLFATKEQPLYLVFDNFEWIDTASLKFLNYVFTQEDFSNVFFLATTLTEKIDEILGLETLTAFFDKNEKIELKPLNKDDILQLLTDSFSTNSGLAKLAEVIQEKTQGTPLFIVQFLKSLHNAGIIFFDFENKAWQWNTEEIQKMEVTENVAELMKKKLRALDDDSQYFVKVASCIGVEFDLSLLQKVYGKSLVSFVDSLKKALEAGILVSDKVSVLPNQREAIQDVTIQNNKVKFLHSQVQQAAHNELDSEQKAKIHFQLGKHIMETQNEVFIEKNIFQLVRHFDIAADYINQESSAEQLKVAKIYLKAGNIAKNASSFDQAHDFYIKGEKFSESLEWTNNFPAKSVYVIGKTESLSALGKHQEATDILEELLKFAPQPIDEAKIYNILVTLQANATNYPESIRFGLDGIRKLGVKFPSSASKVNLIPELLKLKWKMGSKKVDDLRNLPEVKDMVKRQLMKNIINVLPSVYLHDTTLFGLMVLKSVNILLNNGLMPEAGFLFSAYGIITGSRLGDYKTGFEYGLLALELSQKYENRNLEGKSAVNLGTHMSHWINPLEKSIEYAEMGHNICLNNGHITYSFYAMYSKIFSLFASGKPLSELEKTAHYMNNLALSLNQPEFTHAPKLSFQFIKAMKAETKSPGSFEDEEFSEKEFLAKQRITMAAYFRIAQMQSAFIFGDLDYAYEIGQQSEEKKEDVLALIISVSHEFIYNIILAQRYSESSDKKNIGKSIARAIKQFQKWSKDCPSNFKHMLLALQAEQARLTGKETTAINLYNQAIVSADKNGFIQNLAIINELAARFYFKKDMDSIALSFLKDAHYLYYTWGATGKSLALEKEFPNFVTNFFNRNMGSSGGTKTFTSTFKSVSTLTHTQTHTTSSSGTQESLDIKTIMKATSAIADEIHLDKLLDKLLKTLMENAGAQTGKIIMLENEDLFIKATGNVSIGLFQVHLNKPIVDAVDEMAIGIVQYVARTRKPLVLDDASSDKQFSNDVYIQIKQPKSILCLPILRQRKLMGLLYLENNLGTGVFTQERINVLNMLSSQAAISINNATLFGKLETKTNEALRAKTQAEQANQVKSEFLANMSHELRTPLNGILGYAQLMADNQEIPQKYREMVKTIYQSGNHLLGLINQILDLNKIEAGKTEIKPVNFEITQFLQEVYNSFSLKAKSKKLDLEFETYANIPKFIYADELKIRQCLTNILDNAVKFTSEGKISLYVTMSDDSQLVFTIKDTGRGIPEEQLVDIMEPFKQHYEHLNTEGGTGLGLAITFGFVQILRGSFDIQSKENEGTTVTLTIPIEVGEEDKLEQIDNRKIIGFNSSEELRIMVVDDNEVNRNIAKEHLTQVGFEVQTYEGGQLAIDSIPGYQPHLILMDIRMPGITGIEATSIIRNSDFGEKIKIIALTASAFEHKRKEILSEGFDDYLAKPFKVNELIQSIAKQLLISLNYDSLSDTVEIETQEVDTEFDFETVKESVPPEFIEQFEEYVFTGALDKVGDIVMDLPASLSGFKNHIFHLIDTFDYDELEAVLEKIK